MTGRGVPTTRAELRADVVPSWPLDEIVLADATLAHRHAAPTRDDAEPALFIHGLGGQSSNWTDLQAMLRDRVDGVAVDLPGFGWSPPPRDGDWSLRRTAQTLADFVTARWGGRPVHVFGNSLGGSVATYLASAHPELTRTLTLVSPALPNLVPRRTSAHLPVIATPGVGDRLMKRYLALDPARRARATIELCFADPSSVPAERVREAEDEVRRRDTLPYTRDVFVQSLRALMRSYLDRSAERPWRLAERVTAPTLLVYGRLDKLVDPVASYLVPFPDHRSRPFPDRRVATLMRCGHVAQIEAPELVAEAWGTLLPHGAPVGGQVE